MTIDIINTGGTFNKKYNPLNGNLEIDSSNEAIDTILNSAYDNITYKIINIINKDSLNIDDYDRMQLCNEIQKSANNLIIIHGTDTLNQTCDFLKKNLKDINKKIVFTGAMYPFYIEKTEASFNLSLAIGGVSLLQENGIYIAMHGLIASHEKVAKNYEAGKFYLLQERL